MFDCIVIDCEVARSGFWYNNSDFTVTLDLCIILSAHNQTYYQSSVLFTLQ